MKKEFYEKPVTEITSFKAVDIMTTSGPTDDNDTPFPFEYFK